MIDNTLRKDYSLSIEDTMIDSMDKRYCKNKSVSFNLSHSYEFIISTKTYYDR